MASDGLRFPTFSSTAETETASFSSFREDTASNEPIQGEGPEGGGTATGSLSAAGPHNVERKRANRRTRVMLHSALVGVAALGLLALAGLRLEGKAEAKQQIQGSAGSIVHDVIQQLVHEVRPDCFLNHETFTADTPEARIARESIQEWLVKADKWADAENKPAVDKPRPEQWELSLLHGALVCRNIPYLEATAALAPYNPSLHGFSSSSDKHGGANTPEPLQGEQGTEEEQQKSQRGERGTAKECESYGRMGH